MDATRKRAKKLEAKSKTVDFKELLQMEPDSGTTNIRNTSSNHWKRWLDPDDRCLAPFTTFSEYDTIDGKASPCGSLRTRAARCTRSEASGRTGLPCARRTKARSPATSSANWLPKIPRGLKAKARATTKVNNP
ncbi:hypothetical protein ACVME8_008763 [Bradyrhizobium diazoefficiens]